MAKYQADTDVVLIALILIMFGILFISFSLFGFFLGLGVFLLSVGSIIMYAAYKNAKKVE